VSDLRVFIDDGPLGGAYVRVPFGPENSWPERIHLPDPPVSRGRTEEGGFAGYMPSGDSAYYLAGKQDDRTPIYRLVRDA
jgi:hypothetical protein